MATIATHNGSKFCRDHNIRNPKVTEKEKHIDPKGVHEIWHDEKIRDAYKRIFGKAVEEYNARQTREDRKIQNYYNQVSKDAKKHVGYEMIVGVYGKDVAAETGKEILKEFVETWPERNPNLELIGAYYHADEEGQPHVHIDYVPVGHGYSKGMAIQNGLNKALEGMGFWTSSKSQTAQICWERAENQYLEQLCRERGINVERPTEAQKEHVETERYKAEKEQEKLEAKIQDLEFKKKAIQNEINALKEQKGPIGRVGPLRAEINILKEDNAALERDVLQLQSKCTEQNIQISILNEEIERHKELKPSIDEEIERIGEMKVRDELRSENNRLRQLIEIIKTFLKEHFPEAYKAIEKLLDREDHQR